MCATTATKTRRFGSFDAHPGVKATIPEERQPYAGSTSDAAGRYQFLGSGHLETARTEVWVSRTLARSPKIRARGTSRRTPIQRKNRARSARTDLQNGDTSRVASALHTVNGRRSAWGLTAGTWPNTRNLPQTASTGDQPPAAAPASQVGPYAPVPGQPPPQGVYVPPGASPNTPPVRIEGGPPAPAAPPGGLLKLPDPTSAAPPQLLTPPAAGAPGPVTGLLGQQPAQQVAAADAPQLSPAAAAILQGINRQQAGGGLLASGSVAGDNAVPTGGPSPAAVAQAGPPHTGAAGAAELAGLLAQQPASAAPPTATPYTNAPPVTGQGAPAPGPAPGPAPPAPPPAPGGAAPQPVMPSAIPGAPSAQDVRDANRAVILHGIAGIPLPPNIINEIAKFPMVGPTAQAAASGTAAGQQPYQLQQAANKAMWDIYVAQQKPREPQREGSFTFNPQTNQYTLNRSMIEADGSTHQHISILDQNLKPLSDYDAGAIKARSRRGLKADRNRPDTSRAGAATGPAATRAAARNTAQTHLSGLPARAGHDEQRTGLSGTTA